MFVVLFLVIFGFNIGSLPWFGCCVDDDSQWDVNIYNKETTNGTRTHRRGIEIYRRNERRISGNGQTARIYHIYVERGGTWLPSNHWMPSAVRNLQFIATAGGVSFADINSQSSDQIALDAGAVFIFIGAANREFIQNYIFFLDSNERNS